MNGDTKSPGGFRRRATQGVRGPQDIQSIPAAYILPGARLLVPAFQQGSSHVCGFQEEVGDVLTPNLRRVCSDENTAWYDPTVGLGLFAWPPTRIPRRFHASH